jgi:hypothetical protein
MPVISGFDNLTSVPEEQITDKIVRRVVSGKQGTLVYWTIKAGARAATHTHPHEQFVWMVKGAMDFRIANETRMMTDGSDGETSRGRAQENSRCCRLACRPDSRLP